MLPSRDNANTLGLLAFTAFGDSSSHDSDKQMNANGRGLQLIIDITAISGSSPTFTVAIKGFDPASGKSYTLLTSAALNATGTTVLRVYPGLTAAANLVANDVLPLEWYVTATFGGASQVVTATISANVIV